MKKLMVANDRNVGLCLSKKGVSVFKQKLGKLDWKTLSDVKDLLNYPDAHFMKPFYGLPPQ